MNALLKQLGVSRISGEGCRCSSFNMTYTYNLPIGIDSNIPKYLLVFGESSTSLDRQAILKIENQDFSITGVKRLKQIKLIIKNINISHLVEQFEDALAKWLEKRME